jgi:4-hydroxybenzoyl-CoA thioesterase
MVRYERAVRFEEVDAAGIAFFPRFAAWGHEAMEAFFDQVAGGYVDLIMRRRIGFPAVKLEAEFLAPVRYGDVVVIETSVSHLGNRSATFTYRMRCGERRVATLHHTVVISDLVAMRSTDMPADVRAALEAHVSPNAPTDPPPAG